MYLQSKASKKFSKPEYYATAIMREYEKPLKKHLTMHFTREFLSSIPLIVLLLTNS